MGKVEENPQTETAPVEPPKVETPPPAPAPVEPPVEDKPQRGGRRQQQPKVQEVSVTRIVLYTTASGTERPAIVTRVNEDDSVDLSVFNSEGCVAVTGVREADPEEHEAQPHTWAWPVR